MDRILNAASLTEHGNIPGRQALVRILEAGLQAADPYNNTMALLHRDGQRLIVGNPEFEPEGSPIRGR